MRGCLIGLAIVAPFWLVIYAFVGWRGILVALLAGVGVELMLVGVSIIRRAWRARAG